MNQSGTQMDMKLNDYLTWKRLTPDTFAERIGVDVVSVRRYVNGKRRPRWRIMDRIAAETSGHVTANDFGPEKSESAVQKKRKRPKTSVPRSKPEPSPDGIAA